MKTALLIPAYEPDEKLLALLENFRGDERFRVVVVNDGSVKPTAIETFKKLPDFAELVVHEVNRGKGAAIKTGIRYVMEHCPECDFILTADADGQHTPEDIAHVNEVARANPKDLVLGSRKFEGEVPLRSRLGNGITRGVFSLVSGSKVFDTQTGLRAFHSSKYAAFAEVDGDRYEYEINVLLQAAQTKTFIREVWIETVYLNDNESSHFNPLRDSVKIYKCIFRHFVRFGLSSLLAFVIDYVMLLLLYALTKPNMTAGTALLVSLIGARLISSTANFFVNRSLVFKGDESLGKSAGKYVLLAVGILVANYAMNYVLNICLYIPLALTQILTQVVLFFVSYAVQQRFVYRK